MHVFFIHNQDLLYTFPLSFLCFDIKASKNSIWIPAKVWQALFPSNIQSQRRKYWRCEKNHPNFPRLDVIALVMSSLLACLPPCLLFCTYTRWFWHFLVTTPLTKVFLPVVFLNHKINKYCESHLSQFYILAKLPLSNMAI